MRLFRSAGARVASRSRVERTIKRMIAWETSASVEEAPGHFTGMSFAEGKGKNLKH
jgi:hypothetical protein